MHPLKKEADPLLGPDLALHRPVNANHIRGNTREFDGEKAVDGNNTTYWAVDDGVTSATLEIDMENPVEINAIGIDEVAILGQRVQEYKVEGQVDSDWKLLAQGTSIGLHKIDRFPNATVWKVRLTILKAGAYPALSRIALYRSPTQ